MWMFVHLAFLTGFKNRFKTVISWTLSFVGGGRTERALVSIPERSEVREEDREIEVRG